MSAFASGDCAYHSNNASGCQFLNNLAHNCGAGFQRQGSYPPDPALIANVFSGGMRGPGESKDNLTHVDKAWFVAPERYDFRLTPAGKAAVGSKGPGGMSGSESTAWVDRRTQATH